MTDAESGWTYSTEEQQTLTERLIAITEQVYAGAVSTRRLDPSLLCSMHRALFETVRSHAGQPRGPGRGSEYLNFGPHRSVSRDDVEEELEAAFQRARRQLSALDPSADDYDFASIRVAVLTHADIVRIHPFEDGNGRASRLICSAILVRCGLRPVAIEAVKQEYTDALNHYFVERDEQPLLDLYVDRYGRTTPDWPTPPPRGHQ